MPKGCWNPGIRAPAILVNSRHDPMIAILEAGVDGVDMPGRGERAV